MKLKLSALPMVLGLLAVAMCTPPISAVANPGTRPTLEIITTATDTEPPVLAGISNISASALDVTSVDQPLSFDVHVTDNSSGLRWVGVRFGNGIPSGQDGHNALTLGQFDPPRIAGDATDGIYRVTVAFPYTSRPNTYEFDGCMLRDRAGNQLTAPGGGYGTCPPANTVDITGAADSASPQIQAVSLTSAEVVDLSSPDARASVDLDATDPLTGLQRVEVVATNQDTGVQIYARSFNPASARTQHMSFGLYTYPQFVGRYLVTSCIAVDRAGNSQQGCPGDPIRFELRRSVADTTKPVAISVQLTSLPRIDITNDDQPVVLQLGFTDADMGVKFAQISLTNRRTGSTIYAEGSVNDGDLVRGTARAGVIELSLTPEPTPFWPGAYDLTSCVLYDRADNMSDGDCPVSTSTNPEPATPAHLVDDHIEYARAEQSVSVQGDQTVIRSVSCDGLLVDASPVLVHVDQGVSYRGVHITKAEREGSGGMTFTIANTTRGQAQLKLSATCLKPWTGGGGQIRIAETVNAVLAPAAGTSTVTAEVACPAGTRGVAPSWDTAEGSLTGATPEPDSNGRAWTFQATGQVGNGSVGLACLLTTTGPGTSMVFDTLSTSVSADDDTPDSTTVSAPDMYRILTAGWDSPDGATYLGHELQDRQAVARSVGGTVKLELLTVRAYTSALSATAPRMSRTTSGATRLMTRITCRVQTCSGRAELTARHQTRTVRLAAEYVTLKPWTTYTLTVNIPRRYQAMVRKDLTITLAGQSAHLRD